MNNRIYFGFYLFLLLFAVLFLATELKMRRNEKTERRNRLVLISASIFLLWHSLFNVYDVYSTGEMRVIMVITALVAFAAVFWMKPVYALVNVFVNYMIIMGLLRVPLLSGTGINFTISVLLAAVIYMARFQHMCEELEQSRKMEEIRERLSKSRFWLTQEQYELISHSVGLITFQWDISMDTMHFSKEWEEVFGHSSYIKNFSEILKKSEMLRKAQKAELIECMENIRSGKHHQTYEMLLPVKNGEERWFKLQVATQLDDGGTPRYGVGMLDDIMEQKEKIFQLEKEAQNDVFTGSLNKAAINAYGERCLKELTDGKRLVMMIFDMDDFKVINDRYGHPCGDYVIRSVAELLKENAPGQAKIGRLGGDEFVMIAVVDKELKGIVTYAQKMLQAVGELSWNGKDIQVRCSVGIAVAEGVGWTYSRLYREADKALYRAKEKGKNQICFYQKEAEYRE